MAQFLKFPNKKDFGLGKHRVTLPDGGGESPPTPVGESQNKTQTDTESTNNLTKGAATTTSSASPSLSRLVKGVKGLFGSKTVEQKQQQQLGGSPLLSRTSPSSSSNTTQDLINFDEDCTTGEDSKPSPLLHSRVLKKEMIGEGVKGSLENLKTQYGVSSDEEDTTEDHGEGDSFLKLAVKTNGSDRQLTIKRDPDGIGIRLSSGSAPVFITQVEPDSEAMLAGIKVCDVILEVNGRDCRELESEELAKILQLKSLIKKSPRLAMKPSITITSIDSDTDEDDDDIFSFNSSQDKVSIDEELFEYGDNKDKVDLMPLVKEESHEDSTVSNGTTLNGHVNGISQNGFHKESSPVKDPQSPSRSTDGDTSDLIELPVSDRLGVDVGRYKRDIGNARKKKPTRKRPSSMMVHKTGNNSTGDLWGDNSEMRTSRSYSSSSTTSDKKDPPLPLPRQQKPAPPVATRRNKSGTALTTGSDDTLQPSQQEDKTRRRYTVGGAMLKGGNSQLLAEAASARIKLRASVKRNENNSPSKIENEKQTSSEKTPNEKPAWMAALNKKKQPEKQVEKQVEKQAEQSNNTESSSNDTEQTKNTTPVQSAAVASTTPNKETITPTKTVKEVVTPKIVIPPKKPPRTRERVLNKETTAEQQTSASETNTTTAPSKPAHTPRHSKTNIADNTPANDKGTNEAPKSSNETNVTTDSSLKPKPAVTPRRMSSSSRTTSTGQLQENDKALPEDKSSIKTTEPKVDKPLFTPRKPSIDQQNKKQEPKQEPNESKEKTDSDKFKTDQQEKDKVSKDKPAVTPRKPSIDRKKLEPKDIVTKQPETNEGKSNTPSSSASKETTKAAEVSKSSDDSTSTEKKNSSTKPAIGSVKSRLAMFEKR